jgi:hypothetical protein
MDNSYIIKKVMADAKGEKKHVLLLNSQSEVLEISSMGEANELIDILNLNSDSGWVYEIIEIKNK